MEELKEYINKTFDEATLSIIYFMENAKILVENMKKDVVLEGEKKVTHVSNDIVETSYLKLCDNNSDFKTNIMGEIFLHYLDYVLRDMSANWKFDLNRLEEGLATKCTYCNIKLKYCPMKVLAYIKKCVKDEALDEKELFNSLMGYEKLKPNKDKEFSITEKVLKLCTNSVDLKGAEFLLDTNSIKIESIKNDVIHYRTVDFEVKKISFINNLYSFYEENGGIEGTVNLKNLNITKDYSYMFDMSPVELGVYIKYLCEKNEVDFKNVFNTIYKNIGKHDNIAKAAYYNEYLEKINTSFDKNDALKDELKDVLTYIKNYDSKSNLPYVKFDFLIYTKNSKIISDVVSILNKFCRTYNYLSGKNVVFVDLEMFIKRTKDSYDVIAQLDRIYSSNDFIVFTNFDRTIGISDTRVETLLSTIPKFYNRNPRSITILCGEKNATKDIVEKNEVLKNEVFKHIIDVEALDVEVVKEKVYKELKKYGKLDNFSKEQISKYIESEYKKGWVNEASFVSNMCNDIIYNKYKNNKTTDDFKLIDIPEAPEKIEVNKTLEKLDSLVGLTEVKYRVKEIMQFIEYQKKVGDTNGINLNMIFKGNSGTGKTTVSKIIADLFCALGLIKTNKVVEVTGKDLIADHLGQTAPKTQGIIDSALDGVLLIDEAGSMLTSRGTADFTAEAIATLCNSMDRYKERLIIIFSGYKTDMNTFSSQNLGLASRIGFEIEFEDFTSEELMQIFLNKLDEKDFKINDKAKERISTILTKAKITKNFGNARYVENLFDKLVLAHSMNATDKNLKEISLKDVEDMEKVSNEKERTIDDILSELNSLIGLKDIKEVINGFVSVLEFNRKLNRQTDFNMHMIFKGNAGTGKTTVARLIANIYYSLGYIKKNKVVEVQSQDLIGEWLGQTGPKTQSVIDSALDGVLFIDEAYSLMEHKGSTASYTAECIATLLKAMEDYKGRLVVIFAGYTEEMMQFRDLNPGLKSRIGFELTFKDYTLDELVEIFKKKLKDEKFEVEDSALNKARTILDEAMKVENFGNGRFVENMVQRIIIEHAKRMKDEDDIDKLTLITESDISDNIKAEQSKNRIGF